MSTVIAHLSDLHFGREVSRVVKGLLTSLEQVNPDLVVISGDLTQRAKESEFAKARMFLDELAWPYLVIPGNHDLPVYNIRERFLGPWRNWQAVLEPTIEPVIRSEGYIAVGLNTARKIPSALDWTMGRVSKEQCEKVSNEVASQPDTALRIVVAHHPFWLPIKRKLRKLVMGRDAAITHFSAEGIDMILSGHIHVAYAHVLQGIIISHAGTTTSNRLQVEHPNSFNVARGNRRELAIELMNWNGSQFQKVSQRTYEKGSEGWREQLHHTPP